MYSTIFVTPAECILTLEHRTIFPEGVKTSPVNEVCNLFCPKCVDHKKGRCGHFNLCRDCVKLFWAKTTCPDGHTLYKSDRARPRQAYEAASQCAG